MNRNNSSKIIFVTGTDTGVGKTLLTALLLYHLKQSGCQALAMKPFCSGNRKDVVLLQSLQRGELSNAQANPFYYPEPVAPLVSLKTRRKNVRLEEVIKSIQSVGGRCERLIVEGSGGVLVPLGEGFSVLDVIARLGCEVVVVGRNRLGTINHTLLTVRALQGKGLSRLSVAMMNEQKPDFSTASNHKTLSEILALPVFTIPFLGNRINSLSLIERGHKKIKKTLALILE